MWLDVCNIIGNDGEVIHIGNGVTCRRGGAEVVPYVVFFYSFRSGSKKMMNRQGLSVSLDCSTAKAEQ